MKKITQDVYFIPGMDDFIPDSHMYLLGDPASRDLSIVDCGLMGKGKYKLESIKRQGMDIGDIKRIIMTHTHLDI